VKERTMNKTIEEYKKQQKKELTQKVTKVLVMFGTFVPGVCGLIATGALAVSGYADFAAVTGILSYLAMLATVALAEHG
jgi:hypothetical protein